MSITWNDLPEECWGLIFNRLTHQSDLESFSFVCKQCLSLINRLRHHLCIVDSTLVVHGTISKLLHRFTNIKSFDFGNFTGDLDLVLIDLANSVTSTFNLDQLDISKKGKLPIKGLKELGRKLKAFRVLKCSDVTVLTDSDLYAIAEFFPFLEELDISYPNLDFTNWGKFKVTDSGIEVLSVNLRNLRKINVSGNHFITDRSLVALSMNCLSLEGIELEDCTLITLQGIVLLLRTCAALSAISVSYVHIGRSSVGFECLATSSRALQTLNFFDSIICDEFLELVAKASLPLRSVSLGCCKGFTSSGISSLLCAYRSLKFLSLYYVEFLTDESMNDLSRYLDSLVTIDLSGCKRLTILTFSALARNCPLLEAVFMVDTAAGVKNCFHDGVKNTRIRAVNLRATECLDDESLTEIVSMCPNLEMLDVYGCRQVTEAGIASALEVCNKIRSLLMDQCPYVKHIGEGVELPNLEVISAVCTALNDEGLAMIGSRCPRLLKLNLECCEGVTAGGIQAMVKLCRSLREINLKGCPQDGMSNLNNLVFSSSSLRRVIVPCSSACSDSLRVFFLHYGCVLSSD